MKQLRYAALAAIFTLAAFAADPVATKPVAAPAEPPKLSMDNELAITKLLRRIERDQMQIDAAGKDSKDAQEALRALVAKVSPAGYHLAEPVPGDLQFVKDAPTAVAAVPPAGANGAPGELQAAPTKKP